MNRKILFIISVLFIFSLSCTSAKIIYEGGNEKSKDQIIEIAQNEVFHKYNVLIEKNDAGIHKNGYGNWKIILYGNTKVYIVSVTENGEISSTEEKDYVN